MSVVSKNKLFSVRHKNLMNKQIKELDSMLSNIARYTNYELSKGVELNIELNIKNDFLIGEYYNYIRTKTLENTRLEKKEIYNLAYICIYSNNKKINKYANNLMDRIKKTEEKIVANKMKDVFVCTLLIPLTIIGLNILSGTK